MNDLKSNRRLEIEKRLEKEKQILQIGFIIQHDTQIQTHKYFSDLDFSMINVIQKNKGYNVEFYPLMKMDYNNGDRVDGPFEGDIVKIKYVRNCRGKNNTHRVEIYYKTNKKKYRTSKLNLPVLEPGHFVKFNHMGDLWKYLLPIIEKDQIKLFGDK